MPVLPDKLKTVSPDYWKIASLKLTKRKPGNAKVGRWGSFLFAALRPLPQVRLLFVSGRVTSKAEVLGLGLEDAQEAWMRPFRCPGVEMDGCISTWNNKKNFQKSIDLLGKRGWFWRPLIFKTSLQFLLVHRYFLKLLWGPLRTPCIFGALDSVLLSRPFLPGDLEDTQRLAMLASLLANATHKLLSQQEDF